jgi:proteasome lid subunit RPN8/RPN11
MSRRLILPANLRSTIEGEARHVFPRECCGLIEGTREFETIIAAAVHRTRNIAHNKDRFEIDPAEHFKALHAARAHGRDIVGCYHSHPSGTTEPSVHDRESAFEEGFLWLIAAVHAETVELKAHLFEDGKFIAVAIASKAD